MIYALLLCAEELDEIEETRVRKEKNKRLRVDRRKLRDSNYSFELDERYFKLLYRYN